MIGNETDARIALTDDYLAPYSVEGTARDIYLINGVIYKVEKADGANDAEWSHYQNMREIPLSPYIRIPEMSRYRINDEIVIAAEFVNGVETGECFATWAGMTCDCPEPCLSPAIDSEIRRYVEDLAWGNVIVSDGCYYLVDLEC